MDSIYLSVIMLTVLVLANGVESGGDAGVKKQTGDGSKGKITPLDMYKKLFNEHRGYQLEAVKSLMTFGDYTKRYKLIDTMLKQLFQVLNSAKTNLTELGYVPGDPFPTSESMKEAVSKVLENTAMFGDLVLRIPDIVHAIYDRDKDWQITMTWAVWFCNESHVFEGANAKLLHLMAQEIDIIPKEANYVNPFRDLPDEDEEDEDDTNTASTQKQKSHKKKQKEKKKGPRLSGAKHTEL